MDKKEIQKPITVRREEFANFITEACNNAKLPFFVIEDVLNHIIPIVSNAAKEQYKAEKARYEQALQSSGKQEPSDNNTNK